MNKDKIIKRSDNYIPDYDHLFEENGISRNKIKNKVFGKILKQNKWTVIYTLFLYLIQSLPIYVIPLVSANVVNIATESLLNGGVITIDVWKRIICNGIIMILVLAQNIPVTMYRWKVMSKMFRETSAGLKSTVIRKLQSLSITYHKDMRKGKVQAKFLRDTESIDMLFKNLVLVILPSIITVIISTVISVYKNGYVALFFLLVIPINVLVMTSFRKKLFTTFRQYRKTNEVVSSKLSTMLEMIPVTKAHGLESTEISNVNTSILQLKGAGREMDKTEAKFGSSMWVTSQGLSAFCLLFSVCMALIGQIQIGDIVLFQTMFSTISGNVSTIINMLPSISSGLDAVDSISEIMCSNDVEVSIGKKHIKDIVGNIEFTNVNYTYPNTQEKVIKDFSLSVKKGECIAVVGASGSGKSTLMNMIIGFMFPDSGEIKIDGKSITELNLSEYRHHVSVVPQNSMLFYGTIKENITYGLEKYSEEDLNRVVEMANLNEFLSELPNGIDTDIGEHGDKLSGGQKQRITIARALIRNPKILIFDEATSALDNISEYQVQKAIEKAVSDRTTFIVAHRLSTIRNADRIVVLDQGKAVEIGTFDELINKKGKFYELKNLNDLNLKSAQEGLN